MRDICGKNAEKAEKNAIENVVLLEWCLPLETPMFHVVLHDRALKAWTPWWNNLVQQFNSRISRNRLKTRRGRSCSCLVRPNH